MITTVFICVVLNNTCHFVAFQEQFSKHQSKIIGLERELEDSKCQEANLREELMRMFSQLS